MSAVFTSKKRVMLKLGGIVQGVGFRPFVYQKAVAFDLKGFVQNGADGITIEIEGESSKIERFLVELKTPPPLSRIDSLTSQEIELENTQEFSIRDSDEGMAKSMVSADISLCEACRKEMQDPKNRRYDYPFINCTDCGPRYSIIKDLPYDRAKTSMAPFSMCKACQKEYKDPRNRRYHAQPLSCFECGPKLSLLDIKGEILSSERSALDEVCDLIRSGETVAIKGVGGFHLVCDAGNEDAVRKLRENKNRPSKPLAVMFSSLKALKKEASITKQEEELILSRERPIVIVDKAKEAKLAPSIAPKIDRIGVFLPYTPLHEILLKKLGCALVATSANLSDEPIITDETELLQKLSHVVAAVLTYDREIVNACDDSVAMVAEQTLLLRMSRGYAPKSLPLKSPSAVKILALGANQKSTLALSFGDHLVLSPHIGDLVSLDAFEYFERTLETFKRFYGFSPDLIVCDKHPEYETTKWAKEQVKKTPSIGYLEVQHHYAHALACMAEYSLEEKVLAFCFDGTGLGEGENVLWGGEVLIADPLEYERIMHLKPFRLIGAGKAVKEPRRVALALLFECFSYEEIAKMDNATVKSFTAQELEVMHAIWKKGINAPLSSSVGRLFDAVVSLAGISQTSGYEGESGLLIECHAKGHQSNEGFTLEYGEKEIDYRQMVREILQIKDPKEVSSRFIQTLTEMVLSIAKKHPDLPVVLSGGVFQNRLLVTKLVSTLKKGGLRYYIQKESPVNDGGIALGQLYHALHRSKHNG